MKYFDNLLKMAEKPELFPRVLLIEGSKGLGKFALAERLVRALVVYDGGPQNEEFVVHGQHPDYMKVQVAATHTTINTADIQGLVSFVQAHATMGQYKYVIIDALDDIHYTARDALLKTVEDASSTIFFILAHSAQVVSKTIRSRSHSLQVLPKDVEGFRSEIETEDWMQGVDVHDLYCVSSGSALMAREFVEMVGGGEGMKDLLVFLNALSNRVLGVEKILMKWRHPRNALPVQMLKRVLDNLMFCIARQPTILIAGCKWHSLNGVTGYKWRAILEDAVVYHTSWKSVVTGLYAATVDAEGDSLA